MSTEFKSPRARKRAAKWRLAGIIKTHRGCIDCGYNDHAVALQFDHINDDKKASVSNLIRSDYAWSTILEEINKCEVRCANCHSVVTAARKQHAYHESAQSDPYSVASVQQGLDEEVRSLQSTHPSFYEQTQVRYAVPASLSAWFQRWFGHPR